MRISIECDYLTVEINQPQLQEIIQQNIPKIEDALTGDLSWYSQNARLVPDSIKILLIEPLGKLRYKMHYNFRWNIFNACLDIDATDTATESVEFEVVPGALVFDFTDNAHPDTADEL
ncbi:hypothetical protein ED28_17685 [[Pantoea] beijingensis]|uniref:Uncharacterized protein n=1 Tax=[Pantoea] beijingensis TaxID=1324864 RepID=A0A443I9H0_9GAMM|nr:MULTISPECIES: hypothetical protein [Erwiniaceae]RWR00693.1 hypothetical protein ED28_17685 [[Pantoea] beijingensis]